MRTSNAASQGCAWCLKTATTPSEIAPADYTDFYRSVAGAFDEPALTVHFRAEGRQESR
jgi:HSP90 family molecular chaperone